MHATAKYRRWIPEHAEQADITETFGENPNYTSVDQSNHKFEKTYTAMITQISTATAHPPPVGLFS